MRISNHLYPTAAQLALQTLREVQSLFPFTRICQLRIPARVQLRRLRIKPNCCVESAFNEFGHCIFDLLRNLIRLFYGVRDRAEGDDEVHVDENLDIASRRETSH